MADSEMLKKYLKDSGKSKTHVSTKAMVSRPRLDKILDHPETATAFQAMALSKELEVPSDMQPIIFYP